MCSGSKLLADSGSVVGPFLVNLAGSKDEILEMTCSSSAALLCGL